MNAPHAAKLVFLLYISEFLNLGAHLLEYSPPIISNKDDMIPFKKKVPMIVSLRDQTILPKPPTKLVILKGCTDKG